MSAMLSPVRGSLSVGGLKKSPLELLQAEIAMIDEFEIIAGEDLVLLPDQVIDRPVGRDAAAGEKRGGLGGEPDGGSTHQVGVIEGKALEAI